MNDLGSIVISSLLAMEPMFYVKRLGVAVVAFGVSMNMDKVIGRGIALALLVVIGGVLLMLGCTKGTLVDILLGLTVVGSAGYAWWYNH